jgi:hypothetical protein
VLLTDADRVEVWPRASFRSGIPLACPLHSLDHSSLFRLAGSKGGAVTIGDGIKFSPTEDNVIGSGGFSTVSVGGKI